MNSWFLFSTADEFLICYAARDWSVSLQSISRYRNTKERKYWFKYEQNLLQRASFGYGSISELLRKKFQKLSMLLSIRPLHCWPCNCWIQCALLTCNCWIQCALLTCNCWIQCALLTCNCWIQCALLTCYCWIQSTVLACHCWPATVEYCFQWVQFAIATKSWSKLENGLY